MSAGRGRWRDLDYALAAVSPPAIAQSVERYVRALPAWELRAVVESSAKRMDGAQRTQLAISLGFPVASFDEFGNGDVPASRLYALIREQGDLREPFVAFLRENPAAVAALGEHAAREILAPFRESIEQGSSDASAEGRPRIAWQTAVAIAAVLTIAFVPLVAQYVHQRGALQELSAIVTTQLRPAPRAHSMVRRPRHLATVRTHERLRAKRPVQTVTRHRQIVRIAKAPVPGRRRVKHHREIAWKFDPRRNPFLREKYPSVKTRAPAAADPIAIHKQTFADRARLIVESYLKAVSRGQTEIALRHLGLPPNADLKNISEAPIVPSGARIEIVGTKAEHDGSTQVEADIAGSNGEYFAVFTVAPDAGAARISDHYFIPVNRTAEEMAARGLAVSHR